MSVPDDFHRFLIWLKKTSKQIVARVGLTPNYGVKSQMFGGCGNSFPSKDVSMIRAPQACLSRAFSGRDSTSQRCTSKTVAGRSQLHGGYRARERTRHVSVSCSGGHLGRYVGRQRGRHLIDSAEWAYPELHPHGLPGAIVTDSQQ